MRTVVRIAHYLIITKKVHNSNHDIHSIFIIFVNYYKCIKAMFSFWLDPFSSQLWKKAYEDSHNEDFDWFYD